MTDTRPVHGEPNTHFDNSEDGDGWDPDTHSVGWALGWDCQLTFGIDDGQLRATVAVSGETLKRGIEVRAVTSGQLRDYAFKLAELANAFDARHLRIVGGCDRTRTCGAGQHIPQCLGLYRTEAEVAAGAFPSDDVLQVRRRVELSTRAHARSVGANGGGA